MYKIYKELINKAKEAKKFAYAPHSNFTVGAVILTKNGKIYTGTNIENASFSLSICAERVALFKAVSEGEKNFQVIAVVTDNLSLPCGGCCQVLREFTGNLKIIVSNGKKHKITELKELLPKSFSFKKEIVL